ncbi:MAG: AlpA family transcriptional regulator [Cellvibrionales bacterium]|nr:AlpA family transcriptional regulator [Cellvibrionales bacterium]
MLIRLNKVIAATSLSRPTIYRLIKDGDFPKQVPLGGRSVGWVEEEVIAWIRQKIEMRDTS